MRWVLGALIALLLASQYQLWCGKGSVRSALTTQNKLQQIQEDNKKLALRNKTIAADIKDLKSGNQAVEARARSDLGMMKKGETFYQVVK